MNVKTQTDLKRFQQFIASQLDDGVGLSPEEALQMFRTQQPKRNPVSTDKSTSWTDEKNRRRYELVDKEIAGTISSNEQAELEKLQSEMLAYRRKVAPLPLDDLRKLHDDLLRKAAGESA